MVQYRRFPSGTGEFSILGFGCMRFPVRPGSQEIDAQRSEEMLDAALAGGVNYFDTAWPYHNGESEPFLGAFLEKRGARERVSVATKLPSWLVRGAQDFGSFFSRQQERLRTEKIDFYLLHALNGDVWPVLKEAGVFAFLDDLKARGLAGRVGFSFHDEYPVFEEILNSYPWDFCQIQYNFLDTGFQAGLKGLEAASRLGVGVVVMEPLRGGSLTKDVPPPVSAIWNEGPGYSPAEWALRYVWDDDRVQVVLSGMSDLSQVTENVRIAGEVRPASLSIEELERYDRVAGFYGSRRRAMCSGCRYCMPCLQGVDIPGVLRFLNNAFMFEDREAAASSYRYAIRDKSGAQLCVACRECESSCPQGLPIADLMEEAGAVLG